MSLLPEDALSRLDQLVRETRRLGADGAEASLSISESLSVDVRLGAFEGVEREEARSIGLRVFIGQKTAGAATTDISPGGLTALAERVVAMAKVAPEDRFAGLLSPDQLAQGPFAALDLADTATPDAAALEALALRAEQAALDVAGISNSSGAGASFDRRALAFVTSAGFAATSAGTSYGIGVAPLAERDGQKESDHEGRTKRFLADLPSPESLGQTAALRTLARLGARKAPSGTVPVVFENRAAGRLLAPILGAISGPAVARGVSFLKDKMGQPVLPAALSLSEDPLEPRGLSSRAFDGEGAPVKARALIEAGVLTSWLLNAAAARQLGLAPTGHASFGHGRPPGVGASNVRLSTGAHDLDGLLAEAGEGLLVTDMFSPALNSNTGDWSVGVAGFWISGGARAYPVSEVTVAGNLLDIYASLVAGSDLDRRGGLDSPSLLVPALSVAGA